jgi:hypothetical protein
MKIRNGCTFLNDIEAIESFYEAKYVMETCIKNNNDNWTNFPSAIFYTETPHPRGSNYFALYRSHNSPGLMITDGLSAVDGVEFTGVESEDGDIIYSRFRHDYRETRSGAFIDGGRDYTRYGGSDNVKLVKFKVVKDKLEIM